MDISKLKEIHSQIAELEDKASATDSKKETYKIEQEIRALKREFEEILDNGLEEIPDQVELRLKVNKVVKFDTFDFKSWLCDDLLERDSLEDFDVNKELKVAISEDFDPTYEIDYEDVTVEVEDDRYK